MGNRHLLTRRKAYLLAEISQRASLTRFELEAQFLSVDDRENHAAVSDIDLHVTDPMDIDLDIQLQGDRRHVLDGDALTLAGSARRGDLHASCWHIERELGQRLLHGHDARFEQDGRDAHGIGARHWRVFGRLHDDRAYCTITSRRRHDQVHVAGNRPARLLDQ
jgi:hypothetical protein